MKPMPYNAPLGLTQYFNESTGTTEVSWAYLEDADIDHFELQYWDDNKRQWRPYDGRQGKIRKK